MTDLKEKIKKISIDSEKYKKFKQVYEYALKMTERETYQAVEGLFHNLNTLQSRSGNQLPFSSIFLYTREQPREVPSILHNSSCCTFMIYHISVFH